MKTYLACVLLCGAIMLTAAGVHTDNIILMCIGGALAGGYSAMIYKQDQRK